MACPITAASLHRTSYINGFHEEESLDSFLEKVVGDCTCDPSGFQWPEMAEVTSHVYNANYENTLRHRPDIRDDGSKVLCANGFVGTVRIEWEPCCTAYSGLFSGSTMEKCIIRLSSAINVDQSSLPWYSRAFSSAEIFPCVAIKCFRTQAHSGNLLFAGKKTGQSDRLFFKNAVCTHLTEKVHFLLGWVQALFSRYSAYPVQLGVSDFAAIDATGQPVNPSDINFPWCIALVTHKQPRPSTDTASDHTTTEGAGRFSLDTVTFEQIGSIPVGTVLYDIFALPTPDAAIDAYSAGAHVVQHLGRVVTTSPLVATDARCKLFFKHQRKEEDYALKPAWVDTLQRDNTGEGVLGKIGASFIQRLVQEGRLSAST